MRPITKLINLLKLLPLLLDPNTAKLVLSSKARDQISQQLNFDTTLKRFEDASISTADFRKTVTDFYFYDSKKFDPELRHAFKVVSAMANNGDKRSQLLSTVMHTFGIGTPKDSAEAQLEGYKASRALSDADTKKLATSTVKKIDVRRRQAMGVLGLLHECGLGKLPDIEAAKIQYGGAAALGCVMSTRRMQALDA